MVKTSTLAVILGVMVLSVAVFASEADGAGLVWRAVNKVGSLISDLEDVGASGCTNGQVMTYQTSNSTWICGTASAGISSINGDTTAAQTIVGVTGNTTASTTSGATTINLGTDVVMTGGSAQTITKALTINSGILGGDLNANQFTINGWDVETITTTNTLGTDNEIILVNPSTTAYTITLPDATGNTGKQYKFIMISTTGQPVTIDGDASDTIGGKTSQIIEHYNERMQIVSDGTNWQILEWTILKGYNYFELIDDFSSSAGTEASGVHGESGWFALIDGTTGDDAVMVDAPDANHVGVLSIGAGTTSGNDWALSLGGSAALRFMDSDAANWSQTMVLRIPTITTLTVRVGLAETITGASFESADNAFFKFDPAVNAAWQCVSFGSAAETTTTGTTVVANTFYKLKIVKDGSTIRYYINDVNACNHSTQIPSANVNPVMQVQSNTTVLRNIQIDYFRLGVILDR